MTSGHREVLTQGRCLKDPSSCVPACSPSDSLESEACLLQVFPPGWQNASHRQPSNLPCLQPLDWTAGKYTPQFWARHPSLPPVLPMTPLQQPAGPLEGFRPSGTPPPFQHLRLSQEAEPSSCQASAFAQSQTQFAADRWQSTVTPASREQSAHPHMNGRTNVGCWAAVGAAQVSRMPSIESSQHCLTFATPPVWESYARVTTLAGSPVAGSTKRVGLQAPEEESSGSNHITPILAERPQALPSKKRKIAECDDLELSGMGSSFSFRQHAQRSIAMESHESFLKAARSKLQKLNSHQEDKGSWASSLSLACNLHPAPASPLIPQPTGLPSTLSFPWLQQAQPAGPCSRLGRARASDNTTPDLASKYARLEMSGPSLVRWPRLNFLEQRLQAPLSSREAILQWGVCMKASAATIEVARRICQRIKFEVKPERNSSWNEIVTIVGCLWIASKLCERRQTLMTLTSLTQMIAAQAKVRIPNHVFISFEIGIMQKVDWQPLLGCL